MKNSVSLQMEIVKDASTSFGKCIEKSLKSYTKKARKISNSLQDFVDVEDFIKGIHEVAHLDEFAQRRSSIVHTPIDWSKHPPPSKLQNDIPMTIEEEYEEKEDCEDDV